MELLFQHFVALDNVNVNKVASYIRQRVNANGNAERERGFQAIVISLKDSFYGTADGLVGIFRDKISKQSRTATFDLSLY